MHEFDAWKWVELKISVGEAAQCVVTGLAAWWVSYVLARHQTADRALKDLINNLCRDALSMLLDLSESLDETQKLPGDKAVLGHNMFLRTQRLSDSIHSIELAVGEGKLGRARALRGQVEAAKLSLEKLTTDLEEAVVAATRIDIASGRRIESLIRLFRESVIRIQLALV
jgi:hypothetical protein